MHFLPEALEQYTEDHSSAEPELLAQLSRETWQKVVNPRMLSGHLQGRFLSMISKMLRPKRILEIGTYTGYSALCLAEGLAENGELITIDINDELAPFHHKYFNLLPQKDQIKAIYGDANEELLKIQPGFDLVFIDADKSNYLRYFHILLPDLKSGAVVLIDNVLWSGKVLEPTQPNDMETSVLKELNELVSKDKRLDAILLPLRDGLMMIRIK
jgi:caffeoyl-CoA O-methyltransferase